MPSQAASTHKKVVVETVQGERLCGYVNPRQLERSPALEFLDASGQLQQLPWKSVKVAWFVRDWEEPPTRPTQTTFLRRPRLEGLWVRLRFRDNEVLEGLLVNDLLQQGPNGYLITPPDLNGNHQKAFVPRTALAAIEVLGVNPTRGAPRRRRRPAPAPSRQPRLFGE
ncbi:MAG: hypothetical protein V3U28_01840 [Candidatus Acidoferrales bacterium]